MSTLTESDIFNVELNASKECGAFGYHHIYHCWHAGKWHDGSIKTGRMLCLTLRASLFRLGMTHEEIDKRYGKDTR